MFSQLHPLTELVRPNKDVFLDSAYARGALHSIKIDNNTFEMPKSYSQTGKNTCSNDNRQAFVNFLYSQQEQLEPNIGTDEAITVSSLKGARKLLPGLLNQKYQQNFAHLVGWSLTITANSQKIPRNLQYKVSLELNKRDDHSYEVKVITNAKLDLLNSDECHDFNTSDVVVTQRFILEQRLLQPNQGILSLTDLMVEHKTEQGKKILDTRSILEKIKDYFKRIFVKRNSLRNEQELSKEKNLLTRRSKLLSIA